MKQLKTKAFRKWVEAKGRIQATALIATELNLSMNTADKIVRDNYQHKIKPTLRSKLALLVGVSEGELFYE